MTSQWVIKEKTKNRRLQKATRPKTKRSDQKTNKQSKKFIVLKG